MAFLDLGALADQQRIAVPADRVRAATPQVDRDIVAMLREHLRRDRAGAGAEAAVGLLQRDDVGVELAENSEHPRRLAAAVEPDALAATLGGDLSYGGRQHGRASGWGRGGQDVME